MIHLYRFYFRTLWNAVSLILVSSSVIHAEDAALKIVAGEDPTRVEVIARPDSAQLEQLTGDNIPVREATEVLQFSLITKPEKAGPPLFGTYSKEENRLLFRPRHRLVPGLSYAAVLRLSDGKTVRRIYRVPKPDTSKKTVVDLIFPTSDLLPANQLKFYIHFTQPMRESKTIFDHFHLFDDKGHRIYDPWRRNELWNDDATRLTLWIHPGRVKRGVNLREEFGPVLEPDRRYRLVIDAELRDARGVPLSRSFEKTFRTTGPDRQRPVPSNWKLTLPTADTREPLKIEFGESLDRPLLFRFLKVMDATDGLVRGIIEVSEKESVWQFTPETKWSNTSYRVQISKLLEDLAGNTPTRLFDAELTTDPTEPSQLELTFQPMNR